MKDKKSKTKVFYRVEYELNGIFYYCDPVLSLKRAKEIYNAKSKTHTKVRILKLTTLYEMIFPKKS